MKVLEFVNIKAIQRKANVELGGSQDWEATQKTCLFYIGTM